MKETFKINFRSVLSLVLVAAMVLMFAGCGQKLENEGTTEPSTNQQKLETPQNNEESRENSFLFEVISLDGTKKEFTVKYDSEKSVGEALVNEGLISGSDSQYGIMVDTVNGQKYTYDDDKVYWAFYIDGEYAMTGVDSTPIEDGKVYCFKAEKA